MEQFCCCKYRRTTHERAHKWACVCEEIGGNNTSGHTPTGFNADNHYPPCPRSLPAFLPSPLPPPMPHTDAPVPYTRQASTTAATTVTATKITTVTSPPPLAANSTPLTSSRQGFIPRSRGGRDSTGGGGGTGGGGAGGKRGLRVGASLASLACCVVHFSGGFGKAVDQVGADGDEALGLAEVGEDSAARDLAGPGEEAIG